jgi:hypothetical protein
MTFEKAGFRNAVVMKIMPDDATWDQLIFVTMLS